MRRIGNKLDLDVRKESVETLLLMAVLGQESARRSARTELKRRGAMAIGGEDQDDLFMTNLSGVC
jgi:hypothetical protein